MKSQFLLAVMVLMSALSLRAADFTEQTGVQYRDGIDRCQLDIHYPADRQGDLPVVVWFHGGGLTGGNRFVPQQLKNSGMVVVVPNYRLMPKATIDECIDDAAAAVAWAMDHAAEYGGDPTKVFVSGHSAGGYLTSMVGFDRKWLRKYGKEADSIAGLIPYSGQVITHFARRNLQGIAPLVPTIDEYAPIAYARPDAPPCVIITGDRNMELYGRYEENAYMWRLLKEMGHPSLFIYEIQGYDHGAMCDPAHHILKKHVAEILKSRGRAK